MDHAYLGSFMLGLLTDITGSERDETGIVRLKRAPLEGRLSLGRGSSTQAIDSYAIEANVG